MLIVILLLMGVHIFNYKDRGKKLCVKLFIIVSALFCLSNYFILLQYFNIFALLHLQGRHVLLSVNGARQR